MFDNFPLSISEMHDFVDMIVLGEWTGWIGFNCWYRGYKRTKSLDVKFNDNFHGTITEMSCKTLGFLNVF